MFTLTIENGFYHITEEPTLEDIIATEIDLKVDENGFFHIEETFK